MSDRTVEIQIEYIKRTPVSAYEVRVMERLRGLEQTEQLLFSKEDIGYYNIVSGSPLVDEYGEIQPVDRYAFTMNLLDAVVAIHERGVAHGDIHGGNIMTNGESAILIDFENANILDDPRPDQVMPLYIASEIFDFTALETDPNYRPTLEADLFAVGLVLNEIWSGEVNKNIPEAFAYENPTEAASVFLKTPTFPPETPRNIVRLITTLLGDYPDVRGNYQL